VGHWGANPLGKLTGSPYPIFKCHVAQWEFPQAADFAVRTSHRFADFWLNSCVFDANKRQQGSATAASGRLAIERRRAPSEIAYFSVTSGRHTTFTLDERVE
jgi:hypothetical protein